MYPLPEDNLPRLCQHNPSLKIPQAARLVPNGNPTLYSFHHSLSLLPLPTFHQSNVVGPTSVFILASLSSSSLCIWYLILIMWCSKRQILFGLLTLLAYTLFDCYSQTQHISQYLRSHYRADLLRLAICIHTHTQSHLEHWRCVVSNCMGFLSWTHLEL